MNNERDNGGPALGSALWPMHRLGEALAALARSAGLPSAGNHPEGPAAPLDPQQVVTWLDAAAETLGLEANQIPFALDELPSLVRRGAPLLLRIKLRDTEGFLAIVSGSRRRFSTVGPDLHVRDFRLAELCQGIRQPLEDPLSPQIERLLDKMPLRDGRRQRARAALLQDRLKAARFRSCWLLRLPTGSALRSEVQEIGLGKNLATLLGSHLAQYFLFVLSWWLLGRGVLDGTIDRGWLLGWTLLLFSLIPFRLMTTWSQGVITTTAGAWLRRRLLRGALQINRDYVRRKGAGGLFGVVVESGAIESLALSGGVAALFSVVELALALAVLWSGAGVLPGILLGLWGLLVVWLGARYLANRRTWTGERLAMTHRLLESMVGHRTRLAQQPVDKWHPQEDVSLAQYAETAKAMDRASLWLTAFVPRGWLAMALVSLIPAFVGQASAARLAISVGGILLAYRSLRRLSGGLSNLAGAAIAGQSVVGLAKAASDREKAPNPSMVVGGRSVPGADGMAVQARDLLFRYPRQAEPVLHECSLIVPRGARLLLEGSSGAGKTTLGSLMAGLATAESGLLLIDGFDRSVLGKSGWRRRVVMAPQAHDNFLLGGSLAFNLLMGRRWPAQPGDLADAEAVCRELGLGDLLDRLPGGLHQMVGETGWQLSQGERTRVFLARALLQNPDVLILDESFAALDPENVDRASRCVLRRAQTVVAIAHA